MYQIIQADILDWAKEYNGLPFHAMLLDPPYHLTSITKRFSRTSLDDDTATSKRAKDRVDGMARFSRGFMGQQWDGGDLAFNPATWEVLASKLYPGAFIMAFAGTRGYHRMACAMEDAGLIIHPACGWLTLSGFPKATRIDSQLDRAAGAEREVTGKGTSGAALKHSGQNPRPWHENYKNNQGRIEYDITAPATPLAQTWAGHRYGLQALKPSFEFIAVAQVPYSGRPVDSIVATGAGALWIDGGRIGTTKRVPGSISQQKPNANVYGKYGIETGFEDGHNPNIGRWPANFVLTCTCDPNRPDPAHGESCPVRLLDEQSGERPAGGSLSGNEPGPKTNRIYGKFDSNNSWDSYGDSGPASRIFHRADFAYEVAEQLANADPIKYEPKASTAERNAGLEGNNPHPTLKPLSLTKYLATLLSPPAAYAPRRILIPFSGSGSEICGAILSGQWESITGIEMSAEYCRIAEARCRWWSQWPGWGQTDVDKILAADEGGEKQLSFFEQAA